MKIKPGAFWVSCCVFLLNIFCANGVVNDKLEILRLERHITEQRNVQALRAIYEEREKEEQKDPLNFLGQLYKELEEQSKDIPAMDAIVDPPLAELRFHKKTPNCGSEFNITRISELVEEDKRMRKLCPACNTKGGTASLLGWTQNNQGQMYNPAQSPYMTAQLKAQQLNGANQMASAVQQIQQATMNLQQQQSPTNTASSNQPSSNSTNPSQNDYRSNPNYPYSIGPPNQAKPANLNEPKQSSLTSAEPAQGSASPPKEVVALKQKQAKVKSHAEGSTASPQEKKSSAESKSISGKSTSSKSGTGSEKTSSNKS